MKKISTALLLFALINQATAQRLSDTALYNLNDQEQGQQFLEKSRKQKNTAYILLGAGVTSALILAVVGSQKSEMFSSESDNNLATGTLSFFTAVGCLTGSLVKFGASAKNKGRADMLLRTKSPGEAPGYALDLGMNYRKKALRQNMTGWTLLGSGLTMMIAVPRLAHIPKSYNDNSAAVVRAVGMGLSLSSIPFFIKAGGNKARASILMRSENIPFSYLQGPVKMHSIGIGIPLGK